MDTKQSILITGDYVADHHLLKGSKTEASGTEKIGTKITSTYGGARLSFELTDKFLKKLNSEPSGPEVECLWHYQTMPKVTSEAGTICDSYLRWEILNLPEKNGGAKRTYIKLLEKLGFGTKDVADINSWYDANLEFNTRQYKIIAIDEAGIGFRKMTDKWPDFSYADKIILKTTSPLCSGQLWERLMDYKEKLITIVNLYQLKHCDVRISTGISWEQTALDTIYAVHNDLKLEKLLDSSELIILLGTAGAIHIKSLKPPENNEYTLIYDPENMEEEWEERYRGEIVNQVGLGSSFLAGYSACHFIDSMKPSDRIKVGLNTMVAAMVKGVFDLDNDLNLKPNDLSGALDERYKNRYYSSAFIPSTAWSTGLDFIHNNEWSILENNYDNRKSNYEPKPDLHPLAFSLAQVGTSALHFVPRLRLGKTVVFDRNEIENLRNLRKLIDFYSIYENSSKPLNISVFGPPGAGKSFIIKELASELFKNSKTGPSFLTFNLSQIRDESELPGAFHIIRDEVLKGRLPFVFWDEFDSDDYRWLKSFIAPMQDGTFQEGKEAHPIGKCIFVFAGSMTYTMSHFSEKLKEENLVFKKGPDFISRISGYLNVFGPNRKPWFDKKSKQWFSEGDPEDNCFSIRRALFIRHVLNCGDKPMDIDLQLLKALIEVSAYKSGARGLNRLLTNLSVHTERKIELSDLPSKEIIRLNVEYDDFMVRLEDKNIRERIRHEEVARSIHKFWQELNVKESVYYEDYWDLNYDGRIDNICAAQRIRDVVEATGEFALRYDPSFSDDPKSSGMDNFNEHINKLNNVDAFASREHEGWMDVRRKAGWDEGPRSDYHKKHPCFVEWAKLDPGKKDNIDEQVQKDKDRNAIRKYTSMLVGTGYLIISKK